MKNAQKAIKDTAIPCNKIANPSPKILRYLSSAEKDIHIYLSINTLSLRPPWI